MSTRSLWKGPFVDGGLVKKIQEHKSSSSYESNKKQIKTWSRNSTIIPLFVDCTINVHNGKSFIPVRIVSDMVGRKLGEFSPSRIFRSHSGDKKAKSRG